MATAGLSPEEKNDAEEAKEELGKGEGDDDEKEALETTAASTTANRRIKINDGEQSGPVGADEIEMQEMDKQRGAPVDHATETAVEARVQKAEEKAALPAHGRPDKIPLSAKKTLLAAGQYWYERRTSSLGRIERTAGARMSRAHEFPSGGVVVCFPSV